jgi:SAM-dependent methyltransferase
MRITKYILKIIIHNLFIFKPFFYAYKIYLKNSSKNNYRSSDYIKSTINTVNEHIRPTLDELIKKKLNIRILDVGCGPDIFINIYLYFIYKKKINQVMTDRIDELNRISYINNFKYFYKSNINNEIDNFFLNNKYYVKKFSSNKLADKYDLIYSIYVIEHFNDNEINFFLNNIKSKSEYYIFVMDFADTYFIDKWLDESDKYKFQYLKYSNFLWNIINNKFIYQSRMRINDYKNLFKQKGFEIVDFKRCNSVCEEKNDQYFTNNYFNLKHYNKKYHKYSNIDMFTYKGVFVLKDKDA